MTRRPRRDRWRCLLGPADPVLQAALLGGEITDLPGYVAPIRRCRPIPHRTAGDVGWLLFAWNGTRWQLVATGSGYKLGLFRSGSDLLAVQPVYRKNDPNCCPTGGFDHTLYRWNGQKLVVDRTFHTARPD